MDDQTDPNSDVDVPDTQPALLNQNWRVIGARRARGSGRRPPPSPSSSRPKPWTSSAHNAEADVPLPFATPPSAALTL